MIQNSEDIQLMVVVVRMVVSCGLIQNSEDIQLVMVVRIMVVSCGLIQNSEDIQRYGCQNLWLSVVV